MAVQWLRLHAHNAEGLGSILGQRAGSYMLQLKILHIAAKTQHSQKYIYIHIYIYTHTYIKKKKNQGITNVGKDVEKKE